MLTNFLRQCSLISANNSIIVSIGCKVRNETFSVRSAIFMSTYGASD